MISEKGKPLMRQTLVGLTVLLLLVLVGCSRSPNRRVWGEVALEEPLGAWLEQLALLVVLYPPPPIERRQRASVWPSEPVLEGWTDDWKA